MRVVEKWNLPKVTLSVVGESAAAVLADLALMCEVPCIVPSTLDDKLVTLELPGVDGQRAFEEVARAVGMVALRRDGVIVFEPREAVVHDFVVLRPGAERVDDALSGVKSVIGTTGQVVRVGERLVVAGESESLRRAAELAGELESGSDGWLVEVRLVAVSRALREALGVDWQLGGGAGVTVDAATGSRMPVTTPVFGARAALAVDAMLEASLDGREAKLLRTGRVYVLEGTKATLQQGDVIPVPRRTVSDQGTVTVSGYDRIESGFGLDVMAGRVPGGVRLELAARLSNVSGYIEDAPITSESSVTSSVAVGSGEWVLLSGFEGLDTEETVQGVPGMLGRLLGNADHFNASGASIVVCVQAVRVSSSDLLGGVK